MKILHIFGAVVAVHLAVFLIIFAVPGCRSTGKTSASAGAGAEGDSASVAARAPATGGEPMFAPAAAPASLDGALNPGVAASPAGGSAFGPSVRFSPTRPDSAVAAAVQPAAVGTVTPASTYVVVKGDSLSGIAKKKGVTTAEIIAANHLKPNAVLQVGQKLMIAPKSAAGAVGVAAPAKTGAVTAAATGGDGSPVHVVKSGETLGLIAKAHGTTVPTLKKLNNLRSDTVHVGQRLALPDGVAVSVDALPKAARELAPTSVGSSSAGVKHVVKSGETLGSIARKYGVKQTDLGAANHIADPSRLRPGQELVIPGWAAPKSGTAAKTPSSPTPSPAPEAAPASNESPLTPAASDNPLQPAPATPIPVIPVEEGPPKSGQEAPRIL